ncbi:concanavalin A-like lectin/glucanase domain-containing protein [Crepidotus variabilis]|uniref:Endo-1,4-beta-xylanase n=1 Tax=Crepidotus variabilis TaxID=179855 RepID=A0A9P6E662_9AGAR|nr:concanavalin A-like lectin/glucanase domain-containing protein [Crepidotus variabilis]
MVLFSLLAAVSLIPGLLAVPSQLFERLGTPSDVEKRAGTFFSFWSEGGGNFRCNNAGGGSYTSSWSGNGGFVCGKGYSPGGSRLVTTIKYTGSYTPTGPGYLALYGWTRSPLIEYYIIESYDVLAPGEPWTKKGNFTFEEGSYDLYTSTRVNKPSIEGTRTFQQYWSVRTEKRVGGTITTGRHFTEWQKVGLNMGYHDYQILATEGFTNGALTSNGTSSITVD